MNSGSTASSNGWVELEVIFKVGCEVDDFACDLSSGVV